jgi:hypothetical protein
MMIAAPLRARFRMVMAEARQFVAKQSAGDDQLLFHALFAEGRRPFLRR